MAIKINGKRSEQEPVAARVAEETQGFPHAGTPHTFRNSACRNLLAARSFPLRERDIANRAISLEDLGGRSPWRPDFSIRRSEDHQLRNPERRRNMRRTRIVPHKEGGIAHQLHDLAQRRPGHGRIRREGRQIFPGSADENRLKFHGFFEMTRQFQKGLGRPGFLRRCSQWMNHGIRHTWRIPRSARRRFDVSARNFGNRHAQIKHRRRHMLSRMHAPRDSQRLLCGGDRRVVDPSRPEDFKSRAESCAREKRQPGAARSPVQIYAKCGRKRPQRTRARRQNRGNIRMVLEYGGESILHDYGNLQIGPHLLHQMNSRGRKHAITK